MITYSPPLLDRLTPRIVESIEWRPAYSPGEPVAYYVVGEHPTEGWVVIGRTKLWEKDCVWAPYDEVLDAVIAASSGTDGGRR